MRIGAGITALVIVAVACGGTTTRRPVTTTNASAATTTQPSTTTTTEAVTTTTVPRKTTSTIPTVPPELGYVLSDDYTVETVAIIDGSAAGGLYYLDGVLYSADFGMPDRIGDRIYRVQLDGTVEEYAVVPGMDRGTDIVHDDDNLIVASFLTGLIFEIAPDGTAEIWEDTIGAPAGLTLDQNNQIVIGDCMFNQVIRLRVGRQSFDYARDAALACPIGIDFDPSGNVYIAGFNTGVVHRAATNGDLIEVHDLDSPNSDLVYHEGQLFVANRDTHAIFRIDLNSGIVDIVAGNGLPGAADGPGSQATLWSPLNVALGDDGTIYVSHGLNGLNEPTVIRALRPVAQDDDEG